MEEKKAEMKDHKLLETPWEIPIKRLLCVGLKEFIFLEAKRM